MSAQIDVIERLVEEASRQESNIFGYGMWNHHIVDVVRYGKMLAQRLEADPEIVEIAALLHDYAAIKDRALIAEHHLHGANEAQRILDDLGYPADRIERVKECIRTHRASVPMDRPTPEAECLASADAMSHISQVPSLLFSAYARQGMLVDEGAAWVRGKLQRSWAKMHPIAQQIMIEAYQAALLTLGE